MLLGKFMPPHLGHVYLVDFARAYVDDLSVVVGTLPSEPIPGALRYRWMRELFPDVRVIHLPDDLPQDPSEHPEFWRLWREALVRALPHRPDFVFASEAYGWRLAEELGANFVPVDPAREVMPVSGTAVRRDPLGNWQYLPECVRPYFTRRVSVFGPESTGKTTLAQALAREFQTVAVPEYARTLLETQQGRLGPDDIPRIARGQCAAEDALLRRARGIVISDTDLLATVIWSEVLFGECPDWIRREAATRRADLTLLLDVDVPYVEDPVRYLPDERRSFHDRCRRALEEQGRDYVAVSGSWEERWQAARGAVEELIADPIR